MDRKDEFQREEMSGDLPFVPHSSWRHDIPAFPEAPAQRIDAEKVWDLLGV